MDRTSNTGLPTAKQLTLAIELYAQRAYAQGRPAALDHFLPPQDCEMGQWLMGKVTERDPASAPLDGVRSFAMRLGNSHYPHMKLRLSRPPNDAIYVFGVDSHDAFLNVPPESPDREPLEQLKRANATLSDQILAAWDAAGLPTERNYLRMRIERARLDKMQAQSAPPEDASRP